MLEQALATRILSQDDRGPRHSTKHPSPRDSREPRVCRHVGCLGRSPLGRRLSSSSREVIDADELLRQDLARINNNP